MKKIFLLLIAILLLPQVSFSAASDCYTFTKDLKVGDQNEDVRKLQEVLLKEGFYVPATGRYSAFTQRAVMNFQLKYRDTILDPAKISTPSGFFGGATRDQINSIYGCAPEVAQAKVQQKLITYQKSLPVPETNSVSISEDVSLLSYYQGIVNSLTQQIRALSGGQNNPVVVTSTDIDSNYDSSSGSGSGSGSVSSSGGRRGGGGGGSRGGGGGSNSPTPEPTINNPAPAQPVAQIKANNAPNSITVQSGSSVNISWSSINTSSCTIFADPTLDTFSGVVPTTGSKVANNVTASRLFTITCTGPGGNTSANVSVNVQSGPSVPAPTVSVRANNLAGPVTINSGSSATISWTSTNATSCTLGANPASADFTGSAQSSGSKTITNITTSRTFNVACTGAGGSSSGSVLVNVQNTPTPAPINYTITASAGAGGRISPTGAVSVREGASQAFTITPNANFRIKEIKINNVITAIQSTVTFQNVRSNQTIAVTFEAIPPVVTQYTITATANAGGTISPSGAVLVNGGTDKTFTITPNSGFQLSSLKVNNVRVDNVTTYTFRNVSSNHTIVADFTAIPTTPTDPTPTPTPTGVYPHFSVFHHYDKEIFNKPTERVADLTAYPTKTAVASGNWSSTATWGGALPGTNDVVRIPAGINVTLDTDTRVKGIGVKGNFTFDPNKSITLTVQDLYMYEGSINITPSASANHKVVFSGIIDTSRDPAQFGLGFVTIGGSVNVRGRELSKPFSILSSPAAAGERSITLKDSVDWRVGDEVVLGGATAYKTGAKLDSRSSYPGVGISDSIDEYGFNIQTEFKTIASVSGNVVTFTTPLQYAHKTTAGNLTRNVIFTSDQVGGKNGHMLFTGVTQLSFKGARIEKMGRTRSGDINSVVWNSDGTPARVGSNQIGRYALHSHHAEGASVYSGNVAVGNDLGLRWSLVIHGGQGHVRDNVIVHPGEAGITFETHAEVGDATRNLIIANNGGTKLNTREVFMGGGFGIWSLSPFITLEGNVVDGALRNWAFFFHRPELAAGFLIPDFVTLEPFASREKYFLSSQAPLGKIFYKNTMSNNTVFAFPSNEDFSGAIWLWGHQPLITTIDNLKSYNGAGVSCGYGTLTLRNSELHGGVMGKNGNRAGIDLNGANGCVRSLADNVKIEGFKFGVIKLTGHHLAVTNSEMSNNEYAIYLARKRQGHDSPAAFADNMEYNLIDNVRFQNNNHNIYMNMTGHLTAEETYANLKKIGETTSSGDVVQSARLFTYMLPVRTNVHSYNGVSGDNFGVFYQEQASDWVWPVWNISNKDLSENKGQGMLRGVINRSMGDAMVTTKTTKDKITNAYIGPILDSTVYVTNEDQDYYKVRAQAELTYFDGGLPNMQIDRNEGLSKNWREALNRSVVIPTVYGGEPNKLILKRDNGSKYSLIIMKPDPDAPAPPDYGAIVCPAKQAQCPDGTKVSQDPKLMCDYPCAGAQEISAKEKNKFVASVIQSMKNLFGLFIK